MLAILMGLSRRSYLALWTAGCLVGVSGCFEHPGEKRCLYLTHLPEPDARITNAPEIGEIPPRSQPTGIPIDEDRLQSEVGEIAEQVIAGETITTYGHRPIEHGTHVQSDGRYYGKIRGESLALQGGDEADKRRTVHGLMYQDGTI